MDQHKNLFPALSWSKRGAAGLTGYVMNKTGGRTRSLMPSKVHSTVGSVEESLNASGNASHED